MNKQDQSINSRYGKRLLLVVFSLISILLSSVSVSQVPTTWPQTTTSSDGTTISYEVHGEGDIALIFVHGWSCDTRYWRNQVPTFSKDYKVVLADLAGHGHSSLNRQAYSMSAFGEDVKAVAEAVNSQKVILIGHSMGGMVIAEAARLMPNAVIGLIGVDTYSNVAYPLTQEEFEGMVNPLRADFQSGSRKFVHQMFRPDADSISREWIKADMSAASPNVGLSALEAYLSGYLEGDHTKVFDHIDVPVITVNADLWPVDIETNRKYIKDFEAIIVENTDHFLMINNSSPFNEGLVKAIKAIEAKER